MYLVPLLLGLALTLAGLALATDHRGIAQRIVDTYLNPAHADPSLLRTFSRLGVEHPGMDFLRHAPRQRRFVRIWVGFSPPSDSRSWPQASYSWCAPDRHCAGFGTGTAGPGALLGDVLLSVIAPRNVYRSP